jgi:hypothetical protein
MKILSTATTTLVLAAAIIGASLPNAAAADVNVNVNGTQEMDPHHQLVQQPGTRELRGGGGKAGAIVEGAKFGFEIAQAIAPIIKSLFKKKNCHQLACWIAVPNEACGKTAADKVQQEITKGRDAYSVENIGPTGMWARYMRTEFWPPDRSDIATGTCDDGSKFVVTNCMGDHKVHC